MPKCIAVPLDRLAKKLGRVPMFDYAACVLNNWKLIDQTKPLTLENLSVIWSFTKTVAEKWFYLIHIVIENHGAEAMKAVKILAENAAFASLIFKLLHPEITGDDVWNGTSNAQNENIN